MCLTSHVPAPRLSRPVPGPHHVTPGRLVHQPDPSPPCCPVPPAPGTRCRRGAAGAGAVRADGCTGCREDRLPPDISGRPGFRIPPSPLPPPPSLCFRAPSHAPRSRPYPQAVTGGGGGRPRRVPPQREGPPPHAAARPRRPETPARRLGGRDSCAGPRRRQSFLFGACAHFFIRRVRSGSGDAGRVRGRLRRNDSDCIWHVTALGGPRIDGPWDGWTRPTGADDKPWHCLSGHQQEGASPGIPRGEAGSRRAARGRGGGGGVFRDAAATVGAVWLCDEYVRTPGIDQYVRTPF